MRPLNLLRQASFILPGCLLAAGCLTTQDISLGALEPDAGDAPADAGDPHNGPANGRAVDNATRFDAGLGDDRDDAKAPELHDAGSLLDAALALDAAGPLDASAGEAATDASSDATPAREASTPDASAPDASAADGGGDPRNPLCAREPWHCI